MQAVDEEIVVEVPRSPMPWSSPIEEPYCVGVGRNDIFVKTYAQCTFARRDVRAWGAVPREGPMGAGCPTRVRAVGDHVIAEPLGFTDAFESLPFRECVPQDFVTGARHVFDVDDGFLVAYETAFEGEMFWTSADGTERRPISSSRILGFARAPSGAVLALARGKARGGRGGVLRFDHVGRGEWKPRIVTILPVEPSGAVLDDRGALVGFGEGFVFRAGEDGRIENVHYVAHQVGRVASIARDASGLYYLGLECGVLAIDVRAREDHRERWWSARDGASGRWSSCGS